jgi:hypothetical protein
VPPELEFDTDTLLEAVTAIDGEIDGGDTVSAKTASDLGGVHSDARQFEVVKQHLAAIRQLFD